MHTLTPIPIIIDTLDFQCDRDELYRHILEVESRYTYPKNSYNFPIEDPTGIFDSLYTMFLNRVKEHFPNIKVADCNIRQCWGYVSNKDRSAPVIHNHINTASINGVYYLTASTDTNYSDGSIIFYNECNVETEIFRYKPRVNDLLLFPGWLFHAPQATNCEQYRIAINMEILIE